MTKIETARLHLRAYTKDDLDHLASLYADADVTANTKLGQLNRTQSEQVLEDYLSTWRKRSFGVCAVFLRSTGDYVGEAGLFLVEGRDEPTLRYIIHKDYWGQGLAYEAAHAVTGHAFGDSGLERIVAFVEGPNEASHRIARKLGFTQEGSRQIAKGTLYRYVMSADEWVGKD